MIVSLFDLMRSRAYRPLAQFLGNYMSQNCEANFTPKDNSSVFSIRNFSRQENIYGTSELTLPTGGLETIFKNSCFRRITLSRNKTFISSRLSNSSSSLAQVYKVSSRKFHMIKQRLILWEGQIENKLFLVT